MYPDTPSEGDVPPEELPFSPLVFDFTSDDCSISGGDSHVSEHTKPSLQAEEVTPAEPTVTVGTSQRGRVRTMSQRMAESIAQGLHPVAHQPNMGETDEDLFHDVHLELQERMRNMYLQQALRQSDAKEFVQAVVNEVNGHEDSNNWTLKTYDTQIVPYV